MSNVQRKSSGFSLVEVILSTAVFALLVTALVGAYLYGEEATVLAGNRARAALLAEEGIEAVRNIRDSAWNENVYTQSGVSANTGAWTFAGEGTNETIDIFTRTLTFANACRDSGNLIVNCPGLYIDVHTIIAASAVSWQQNLQRTGLVTLVAYLTNWSSQNWTQTDWSGGAGQSIWLDAAKYNTDDSDVNIGSAGQITLAPAPESWINAGGSEFSDATDTDFNNGTYASTVVQGSGADAKVVLDQTASWIEHATSGFTGNNLFDLDVISGTDIWAVGASGNISHYDGASWSQFANTGSSNINGIDMVTAADGWAVGDSSKFYRYNGAAWSEFADLGSTAVNDLEMLSSASGWAVGNSAKFYRYNGAAWSEFVDLGAPNINSIDMISATDGWAAGNSGKIYRYNGVAWSEFVDKAGETFNALTMVSAADGWVVGNTGHIYRWNGTSWDSVSSPITDNLNNIFMITASDGWIVGDSGKILHWNGSVWNETIDIGATALNAVAFVNAANGWALGNGGMVQQYFNAFASSGEFSSQIFDSGNTSTVWSTIAWTETLPAGADITLSTKTGNTATPDALWSSWTAERTDPLGEDITSPAGRYIQYRATFTRGTSPLESPNIDDVSIIYNAPTTKTLNDISVVNVNNIWAVGNTGVILNYDGASWSPHADSGITTTQNINGIDMVSATDGWAVSDSEKFFHYNGTSWIEVIDFGSTALNALDMASTTSGWAVGNSEKFYRYDGAAWSDFADIGATNIFDVNIVSANDAWAVGANGLILHYDGIAWSEFAAIGSQNINAVAMVSATDGWAVGNSGKFYHYNGTAWSEFLDVGTVQLNDVSMISATEGFAAGNSGNLYKYNGATWIAQSSPTNKDLQAITMISNFNGWSVGNSGTILHFVKVGLYQTQGLLTSSAFNAGGPVKIQVAEWDETVSSCAPACQARLQVRAAPDNGGLPGAWSSWYGASGADTYFTYSHGTLISTDLNNKQWIQYRIELTGNGNDTPAVSEIRINYK
jgi:hypothetical protein